MRTREHFQHAIGRRVRLKTDALRLRGQVAAVNERTFALVSGSDEPVDIPYDSIVRANLIDEGGAS